MGFCLVGLGCWFEGEVWGFCLISLDRGYDGKFLKFKGLGVKVKCQCAYMVLGWCEGVCVLWGL